MPSLIYTKNTSGAIRRLRNKKPTKGYLSALVEHIKFLKSLGFKIDSKGKMKRRFKKSAPLAHSVEQLICNQQVACSNQAGGTTTKPVDNWRLRESKKFTIAPAYNKGGYQVISKENIKNIGK
jgi:hypothetical protein|tara:strand:+ start:127 stop:495 length:369 start_codon:yes stop_codon:yes gene_type:complete